MGLFYHRIFHHIVRRHEARYYRYDFDHIYDENKLHWRHTMPTETETYPIAESITVFWTLGTYQGMENVNTIYGVKSLKHYVDYNGSMTSDYYVGKDNNWPYKIVESESGFTIPFEISDTNIDWVKNG